MQARDVDLPEERVDRVVQRRRDVSLVEAREAADGDLGVRAHCTDPLRRQRRPARVFGGTGAEPEAVIRLVAEFPPADVPGAADDRGDHLAPDALMLDGRAAPPGALARRGTCGDEPRGVGDHAEHLHAVPGRQRVDAIDTREVGAAELEHRPDREVHPQVPDAGLRRWRGTSPPGGRARSSGRSSSGCRASRRRTAGQPKQRQAERRRRAPRGSRSARREGRCLAHHRLSRRTCSAPIPQRDEQRPPSATPRGECSTASAA